ncbi:MAG: 2-phospho-L-lactate guanylyltransferase [Anaerolineae bacterium]|nr:2-phospho-L-lactate guanylyltransferase [Anaerolineae bacterium]
MWAIVPVKPWNLAKSRLQPVLSQEQREQLSAAMLRHVLTLLVEAPAISGVLVISRDSRILAEARALGANTVIESGAPELNASLTRATQITRTWGASATLMLPSDLPLLTAENIAAIVAMGRSADRMIVIAPDRHEDGTNALLMRPPAVIEYAFGPGSFARHKQLAEAAGAAVQIYRVPQVSLDIDTRDDLAHYRAMAAVYGQPLLWPDLMELSLHS